ncbi:MAG: DUF6624 domain-containing protein [Bacteroidota bacterium]
MRIFFSLHTSFCAVLMMICLNATGQDAAVYKAVAAELEAIGKDDQRYRDQLDSIGEKFGMNSVEFKMLWRDIDAADAANLIKTKGILSKYGWLGPKEVGDDAHTAIFLVIQHADLATQKKYLPMFREGVTNKNGDPAYLAMLEDRVAIGSGEKQIYGSQVKCSGDKCSVSPLEDPDNVDKRRQAVGLGPLAEYLKDFGIVWDLAEYKRLHP